MHDDRNPEEKLVMTLEKRYGKGLQIMKGLRPHTDSCCEDVRTGTCGTESLFQSCTCTNAYEYVMAHEPNGGKRSRNYKILGDSGLHEEGYADIEHLCSWIRLYFSTHTQTDSKHFARCLWTFFTGVYDPQLADEEEEEEAE